MSDYTVEATTAAVTDGDWSRLRRLTDLVPGTLLLQDSEQPTLIFPVQADSPSKAALFVEGILKLVDLDLVSGTIAPTPEPDFDLDEDDDATADVGVEDQHTEAERVVHEWIERVPSFDRRVADDGSVTIG